MLSPSRRRHRHLDRVLDVVPAARLLDQADGPLDGERRVVLEPEREREEEEQLRVGRSFDRRVERRVDREREVALDASGSRGSRRCASRASCRGGTGGSWSPGPRVPVEARMWAKMSGEEMWAAMSRRLRSFQAGSVPWNTPGVSALAVPADAEPVAVRGRRAEPRVLALVDQRVDGLDEQLLQQHGRARVGEPATHVRPPFDAR